MPRPLDSFNSFNKPHMARGEAMWGGMAVVVSPNIPKEHTGDELVPVWPWWRWFYHWWTGHNPLPRHYRQGQPIMEDRAYMMADKLFVSPAMWAEMRKRAND